MESKKAVIKTGGKQYLVAEGQAIKVEKLEAEKGAAVAFNEVLLVTDGGKTSVGKPFVEGGIVSGKVLEHGRHEKVTGVKYKAKKRQHKAFGHRQHYTEVLIEKIGA